MGCGVAPAAEIDVGPGKEFQAIEQAVAKAVPGDTILVYPLANGQPYEKVALLIRKANLTISAVTDVGPFVKLSGTGFDYSGAGSTPRAIVQFDPAASGCTLEGFELSGAHNRSFNGAGVRINQANNVQVGHCDIHDNDMGIMSNGNASVTPPTGDRQHVVRCHIHHNGALADPGQNHNLYLGGTSVTVEACEIYASLTGHNIKSRAHVTRVISCYIHDAASREIDLVDEAGNTDRPGSDALLLGNVIVKAKGGDGNHAVIQFGQDVGHDHVGTLYLVHNTIVTPYISPVIDLSAPHVDVYLFADLVWDGASGQKNQQLVKNRTGADVVNLVTGQCNFFCGGFGPQGDLGTSAPSNEPPPLTAPDRGDYTLAKTDPRLSRDESTSDAKIPKDLLGDSGYPTNNRFIGAMPEVRYDTK